MTINRIKHDSDDVLILAQTKPSGEKFIFLFCDNSESRALCLRYLGRFASNPELSFTWYDAAVLSQKIRNGQYDELPHLDKG